VIIIARVISKLVLEKRNKKIVGEEMLIERRIKGNKID
jgi:hypothetical protein